MSCVVKGCTEITGKKSLMCSTHWNALPITLREDVRKGTEKGAHTSRAHPTREWLTAASKYVGTLRNLIIQVGVDNKIKRHYQKPQDEPTAPVV